MLLFPSHAPSRGGEICFPAHPHADVGLIDDLHWPMGCGQKGQWATIEQKLREALQVSTSALVLLYLARKVHPSSPCPFCPGPSMRSHLERAGAQHRVRS